MDPRINSGRIQVFRFLKRDSSQLIIDWATSMLADGHDSPSLQILAGLVVPNTSIFEITDYLCKSLEELGIPILEEDNAIKAYAYEILIDLVKNRIEKE